MSIIWKAKICSGMDVVEKITFIKEGTDENGNKVNASAVYIPGADDAYKIRSEWTDEEINTIGDTLSNDLDAAIIAQGGS